MILNSQSSFAICFLISSSPFHLTNPFSFYVQFLLVASFLSLLSKTLDRTWLNTTTACIELIPPSVLCQVHCRVFCIPAGLLSGQPLQYRQSWLVQAYRPKFCSASDVGAYFGDRPWNLATRAASSMSPYPAVDGFLFFFARSDVLLFAGGGILEYY